MAGVAFCAVVVWAAAGACPGDFPSPATQTALTPPTASTPAIASCIA